MPSFAGELVGEFAGKVEGAGAASAAKQGGATAAVIAAAVSNAPAATLKFPRTVCSFRLPIDTPQLHGAHFDVVRAATTAARARACARRR
ncbi:MAG TPA: hypothetical protein VLI90_00845 [Tepidisphaeraceae bacterium]|nr:hypothetical protein [Tepidisphaeraceae bacterium]